MAADRIEFEEPSTSICDCCGAISTHLVRFVTRDESAFAVYFADYSDTDFVSVLVGFGNWDDDASPAERTAFAFRIWVSDDSYQVGIIDPDDAHWKSEYLGKILTRDAALKHKLIQEVFDPSDHIVECDLPVIEYLNSL